MCVGVKWVGGQVGGWSSVWVVKWVGDQVGVWPKCMYVWLKCVCMA